MVDSTSATLIAPVRKMRGEIRQLSEDKNNGFFGLQGQKMAKHSHNFVETYEGLLGFGYDRETDENTVICYLQKFSDDRLMQELVKRLSDAELDEIFSLITRVLKKNLTEPEYHALFLKDAH
jgi:hypothetical protein